MLSIVVKDKDGTPVTLTNNLKFETMINTTLFTIESSNLMKNELLIKVKKNGFRHMATKSIITAKLKNYAHLKDQKEATLTSKIRIDHPTSLILLPQDDIWYLHAKGGSGTYRWLSRDALIGRIDE